MTPARGETGSEPSAAEKVAAVAEMLRDSTGAPAEVRETSMAWVFLTPALAYKMKKPIRRNSIDFTSLDLRHDACAGEVRLNRRLAADVYLGLSRLARDRDGTLALDGPGATLEWLVRMRRLSDAGFLDRRIEAGTITEADIDAVAERLARFHRTRRAEHPPAESYLGRYRENIGETRDLLGEPPFAQAAPRLARLTALLARVLDEEPALLLTRLHAGRVVEGHGDLRPEHVWLGPPIRVIDCLELARLFRLLDPFEEYATLAMECAALGADRVGPRLRAVACRRLDDDPGDRLWAFYTAYRATFRARQALAHLLDPAPRTPGKWPPQAERYLAEAERAAAILETPEAP
jgi:aminoglycoside phosphotransferase family enzyme